MRSSNHLFVYWKLQLAFFTKWNEQPHRFLAVPTIWRLRSLLRGVYGLCSARVKCAETETTGRKFATWHVLITHQWLRTQCYPRKNLFAACPGMLAKALWFPPPALVSHLRNYFITFIWLVWVSMFIEGSLSVCQSQDEYRLLGS